MIDSDVPPNNLPSDNLTNKLRSVISKQDANLVLYVTSQL